MTLREKIEKKLPKLGMDDRVIAARVIKRECQVAGVDYGEIGVFTPKEWLQKRCLLCPVEVEGWEFGKKKEAKS